jgi:hypothetical protein
MNYNIVYVIGPVGSDKKLESTKAEFTALMQRWKMESKHPKAFIGNHYFNDLEEAERAKRRIRAIIDADIVVRLTNAFSCKQANEDITIARMLKKEEVFINKIKWEDGKEEILNLWDKLKMYAESVDKTLAPVMTNPMKNQ